MIDILIWILIVIFGLKLLFTIVDPLLLISDHYKSGNNSESRPFHPPIEILILLAMIFLAVFSKKDRWFNKPTLLAIYGSATVVLSYGLMFIMIVIACSIVRAIESREIKANGAIESSEDSKT